VPNNGRQLALPMWNEGEGPAADNDNISYTGNDSAKCGNNESGPIQGALWPELAQSTVVQQEAQIEEQMMEHRPETKREGRGEVPNCGQDLEALKEACHVCDKCSLKATCTHVVFGEGNPKAKIMFVGEGPGSDEDKQGRPFVGAAGQLLDKILASVGLSRDEVYITNVVKCRPPKNRMPNPDEILACSPYLDAQIKRISPSIIVCLGALATKTLIDKDAKVTRIRGEWHEKDGILYMPTFHPAALLRDPSKKRPVWEDMKKVKEAFQNLQA